MSDGISLSKTGNDRSSDGLSLNESASDGPSDGHFPNHSDRDGLSANESNSIMELVQRVERVHLNETHSKQFANLIKLSKS